MTILSAGVTDIISFVLNKVHPHWSKKETIKLIANKFKFDGNNHLQGYEKPYMHSAKKRTVLDRTKIPIRDNMIIFGDLPGVRYTPS